MWSLAGAALLVGLQAVEPAAEGLKALEAGKYQEAVQLLAKAVETGPADYAAYFHLALAQSFLGHDPEAIGAYKKALELKPGLYPAELNLGIVLLRQKQAGEAIPHLESAAKQKPQETRPLLYLGQAWFETGDYARARQAYEAVAALDPKSAPAQLGLAQSLARQNRLLEAEPHFRKAAELEASFKDALLELAVLFEKNQQAEPAIVIYREFPDNLGARERLGALLMAAGRPSEAVPHLEWVVGKSPSAANRVTLALAYRRTNQPEKELAMLEQAVQAEPASLELRMFYGRALRDQKNYSAAARQFLQAVQAKPDLLEAWNELAAMLISLGDNQQALAALDRVKALGGESEGHLYLRAIVLDKLKDVKGALATYQRFLAASQGRHPEEEFKARQRVRVLEKELSRR